MKLLFSIIFIIVVSLTANWYFTLDISDELANGILKSSTLKPINPPLRSSFNPFLSAIHKDIKNTVSHEIHASHAQHDQQSIQQLMDKQINNATRLEINQQLIPTHTLTEVQTNNGKSINTSGIALSVMVQLLNEDGSVISLDITSPLPLLD
ncbi:MAG: hypothetical protein CBD32_03205 [Actinobacteria bacterium TMED172]|nr:hypothetical protein [Cellvibrionales bacterium]OUW33471.1 MAG: hypothetical protein CBD32_03205 [Actinobacteria bacterium TMED172]